MDSVAFGRKGSQDIVAPLPEWATVNKSNVTGQDMRLHKYIDLIDLGWNEFRAWHALESDLTRTWARGLKSHLSPPSFCHFLRLRPTADLSLFSSDAPLMCYRVLPSDTTY